MAWCCLLLQQTHSFSVNVKPKSLGENKVVPPALQWLNRTSFTVLKWPLKRIIFIPFQNKKLVQSDCSKWERRLFSAAELRSSCTNAVSPKEKTAHFTAVNRAENLSPASFPVTFLRHISIFSSSFVLKIDPNLSPSPSWEFPDSRCLVFQPWVLAHTPSPRRADEPLQLCHRDARTSEARWQTAKRAWQRLCAPSSSSPPSSAAPIQVSPCSVTNNPSDWFPGLCSSVSVCWQPAAAWATAGAGRPANSFWATASKPSPVPATCPPSCEWEQAAASLPSDPQGRFLKMKLQRNQLRTEAEMCRAFMWLWSSSTVSTFQGSSCVQIPAWDGPRSSSSVWSE